jgi:hypothetical protein
MKVRIVARLRTLLRCVVVRRLLLAFSTAAVQRNG